METKIEIEIKIKIEIKTTIELCRNIQCQRMGIVWGAEQRAHTLDDDQAAGIAQS